MPQGTLVAKVFPKAIAPFLAATIEHLAIAKGFARKNGYVIDPAQELVYLGVTNFFNSFFSSMAVGGAMSRTAVNSATGVKSPAYGIIAGGVVVLSIFELSPALFWIPKATLAAIIVTAVWSILSPPKVFAHYWKTSLVDFIASQLAFWLTLFESTEIGIGSAVGFQLVYHILYTAFSRVRRVTTLDSKQPALNDGASAVASDAQVFKPHQSMIFYNAFRIKEQCFDSVQTYNSGSNVSFEVQKANRMWSTAGERRAKQLRKKAGITTEPNRISIVVMDLQMAALIDTTGIIALQDFKADIKRFAGDHAELRFVNVHDAVREKFARFGWTLYDADPLNSDARGDKKANAIYRTVTDAVNDRRGREMEPDEIMVIGDEKV